MSIDVETDGHVRVITINRPEARNAIDPEHNAALGKAVEEFETDQHARVAVLTGAEGATFCAGADLKQLLPPFRDAVRAGERPEWNFGGFTATERSKPIIAAINGHALAGGLEIALACDIRLAVPEAAFGLAETRWALIPGAGGTVRLPRAVPVGVAMEMILAAEPIDAAEAHRIGLVNRLVPAAELRAEALRVAGLIAQRGPVAVRAARASILKGLDRSVPEATADEFERFREVLCTEDADEGMTAFAERRAPVYRGG